MNLRLCLDDLTYDGIGDYIASVAEIPDGDSLYLLGKSAAYVDIAAALGYISRLEGLELRTLIAVHAGILDPSEPR